MTTKPKTNIVSFFADGPRWDNLVKITAYPTGYSYFRPFRYRDEWIQENILEILHEETTEKLHGKAILGATFINEKYKNKVLPLREIDVKHIEYSLEQCFVQFVLGRLIKYRNDEHLSEMCLDIPLEAFSKLFFSINTSLANGALARPGEENEVWPIYCGKIANDDSLPISEDARKSLYLSVEFTENGESAPPNLMNTSSIEGPRFGPLLQEGKSYELVINHRVPYLFGTNTSINSLDVEYKVNGSNIDLNRYVEEYSPNYQRHVIALAAKESSDIAKEIVVDPNRRAVDVGDGTLINTHTLHIPYKVERSNLYRFRRTGIYYFIVFLALLVTNLFDIFADEINVFGNILLRLGAPAIATVAIFFARNKA